MSYSRKPRSLHRVEMGHLGGSINVLPLLVLFTKWSLWGLIRLQQDWEERYSYPGLLNISFSKTDYFLSFESVFII